MMKIADWLKTNTSLLTRANIATARLDCLVLLEDTLGKDRAYLLSNPEKIISKAQLDTLDKLIAQRAKHQPLAYIRGKTEFYGRTFLINPTVLEPRPESETMIDLLLSQENVQRVIDVGCGSGALGITAKLELPSVSVLALDIDANCLDVTQKNIALHKVNVQTIKSNLLKEIGEQQIEGSFLLANLPYVPDDYTLNQAAYNEPRLAIFGGPDGLDVYRKLFEQISYRKLKPTSILCESLPPQHQTLASIASQHGFNQTAEDDFIQLFSPASNLIGRRSF